ncbi:hypothetical protein CDAR_508921 [Caerostris darwini]|uniref:C2H2-type domain-containing protein n=1 Tax=Caerostris darwini TaxID=1538125 RepID=A0AAV4N2E9_9ARAC|nr:hypothetical protein CDAR_508921 [Caerostris darwini]
MCKKKFEKQNPRGSRTKLFSISSKFSDSHSQQRVSSNISEKRSKTNICPEAHPELLSKFTKNINNVSDYGVLLPDCSSKIDVDYSALDNAGLSACIFCDKCGKALSDKSEYERHFACHMNEKLSKLDGRSQCDDFYFEFPSEEIGTDRRDGNLDAYISAYRKYEKEHIYNNEFDLNALLKGCQCNCGICRKNAYT